MCRGTGIGARFEEESKQKIELSESYLFLGLENHEMHERSCGIFLPRLILYAPHASTPLSMPTDDPADIVTIIPAASNGRGDDGEYGVLPSRG